YYFDNTVFFSIANKHGSILKLLFLNSSYRLHHNMHLGQTVHLTSKTHSDHLNTSYMSQNKLFPP
ncbi:hypothetical protein LDENG_00262770, partial [Lucifuga dentata]